MFANLYWHSLHLNHLLHYLKDLNPKYHKIGLFWFFHVFTCSGCAHFVVRYVFDFSEKYATPSSSSFRVSWPKPTDLHDDGDHGLYHH